MEKTSTLSPTVPGERLESWKEIGSYLNRDVRTVQRWEQTKGLPVRRLPGGDMARVYALRSELNAWWSSRGIHLQEAAHEPAPLPSIAVLPFANLSADKGNEYFSDGLADDIIDALTKVPGLRVIARTSAFAFRGKDVSVSEIGAQLKVATILEGSVRKAGSRIRVSAQLIKTADQSHLWSEHYDREMTDVFAIQDEISQAIVEKLSVRLAEDRPLIKRHTENVEAYNLFLRGRHCIFRLTPESLAKGKEYLEQAIALDANYALPYTGMAEYYWASAFWGFMLGSEAIPRAKAAALAALKLDDTLAEAHAQLGVPRGSATSIGWERSKNSGALWNSTRRLRLSTTITDSTVSGRWGGWTKSCRKRGGWWNSIRSRRATTPTSDMCTTSRGNTIWRSRNTGARSTSTRVCICPTFCSPARTGTWGGSKKRRPRPKRHGSLPGATRGCSDCSRGRAGRRADRAKRGRC
jgi:TolB-like protein